MADANSEKPLVSILIVNFNGLRFLQTLFDSLQNCTYTNLEIIFIDNCSADNSVEFVQKNYPEIKIVRNPENYMFARGNNEGIKIANGEILCLLNNDVQVNPGFIEPIIEVFEAHTNVGACQSKMLEITNRSHLEYTGACGGYIDWAGFPFLRGRIMDRTEPDEGQYDEPAPIFWGSGACLFMRKEAALGSGLLDEEFELHMEEIDLCWRLRLAGWKIYSIPASKIWHHGGGTLNYNHPIKIYYNFRNNIFMLVKNLSAKSLLIRLPIRLALDAIAFVRSLLIMQISMAFAILRAYGWLLTHIRLMFQKRRQVQRQRRVSDKKILELMYPGSIVFEFFLLGKKRFSDLIFYDKFKAVIKQNLIEISEQNQLNTFQQTKDK